MSQSNTTRATDGADDDGIGAAVAALRELLSQAVMLPRDILRETLDDAVRRGRMTREDAEELVERLAGLGRQQTEETLARVEALVTRPTRTAATGARDRAQRAVKRPPGTDRVLREVDRARRAAGLGSSFPITNYEELTAAQIIGRLGELTPADLRRVRDHERRNANRKSVLAAVDKQLA